MRRINVKNHKELVEIIKVLSPVTVPILVGEAGIGKSQAIEYIKETTDYDAVIVKRMAGITDEILVGIPEPNSDKTEFGFIKMDFVAYIQQNPTKKILLMLDEINRTPTRLRPTLFELFERRIDSKHYPNLSVVCAINLGTNYETEWDITEDKALLSRVTLINYEIEKAELLDRARNYFNFNSILCDIMYRVEPLIDNETKLEEEQTTNMRSWTKLNAVIQENDTISEISYKINKYSRAFFNDNICRKLQIVAQDMIRARKEIDYNEVIRTKKFPVGISDLEGCLFIKEETLKNIDPDKINIVMEILSKRKDVMISFIQQAGKRLFSSKIDVIALFSYLSKEEIDLVKEMAKR